MKLDGPIAVVTGAGRGIGRAIAEAQARKAPKSPCCRERRRRSRRSPPRSSPGAASPAPIAVDVVDRGAVEKTFAAIERELGPVSLLTNNAGAFFGIGPIWTVDPDEWWRDVETNVRGAFHCCRAALPGMIARRRGRIINLAGGGAATSFPNGSGYATSKAGLLRFTESVNDTLANTGVLAFAMDPGSGAHRDDANTSSTATPAAPTSTPFPNCSRPTSTCRRRSPPVSASRSARAVSTGSPAAC